VHFLVLFPLRISKHALPMDFLTIYPEILCWVENRHNQYFDIFGQNRHGYNHFLFAQWKDRVIFAIKPPLLVLKKLLTIDKGPEYLFSRIFKFSSFVRFPTHTTTFHKIE
jgi:hypothetical protein